MAVMGRPRARTCRRCNAVLAAVVACAAGIAHGADGTIWLDVVAQAPIEHGVTVRGPFDDSHRKVQLAGPVGVVAIGSGSCHAVYAVDAEAARAEPERSAAVGTAAVPVRLGPPAFLLVPARRLCDGEPATDAPAGVYEARPIIDPPAAIDGAPAGRPTHLCLPVDYRHHFERVPVADAHRGLLVCAPRAAERTDASIRTADDFGLHRLTAGGTCRDGAWVPVRAPASR